MFYMKIHNILIKLDAFNMIYYQTNNEPRFTATMNQTQDLSTLYTALMVDPDAVIDGLTIYSDEECTQVYWQNNQHFKLDALAENSNTGTAVISKFLDLTIC